MFMPSNIQESGMRSIQSLDRVRRGLRTLYAEMMTTMESGDSSEFEENEEYYDSFLKSLRFAMLDNYSFLVRISDGNAEGPTIMQSFISDKNELEEAKAKANDSPQ